MCLILFAHRVHPRYPLIIAANRDEFHERETAQAHWWADEDILAGRDLEAGGTWLGVNRQGAFAAVTNYRDPSVNEPGSPSRGELPVAALRTGSPGEDFARRLAEQAPRYNGFNLLFGGRDGIHYVSNRAQGPRALARGFYGLSNELLETPWPKVDRGKALLRPYLEATAAPEPALLLDLLHDRERPDDAHLPDTGIGLEWERLLAPMFIVSRRYGTRASTVVTLDDEGLMRFAERTYDWHGDPLGEIHESFHVAGPGA
ncbi:NRDE family protein [Ectothiorhodospiraceae bacterium WFHF3C12]|nr:NRDE family protein [Ectothiorhodospiraceae bacterium WFHF3C12]